MHLEARAHDATIDTIEEAAQRQAIPSAFSPFAYCGNKPPVLVCDCARFHVSIYAAKCDYC